MLLLSRFFKKSGTKNGILKFSKKKKRHQKRSFKNFQKKKAAPKNIF